MQFDRLLADGDHLGSELDSDGDLVLLPEAMVDELQEKAGFSDTSNHIDSIPVSPIMMNLNMYEKDILFDSRYNYKLSPTKYPQVVLAERGNLILLVLGIYGGQTGIEDSFGEEKIDIHEWMRQLFTK